VVCRRMPDSARPTRGSGETNEMPKRILKWGLLHGPRRVEVEDVGPRHAAPCGVCGRVPRSRRLRVVDGSGRASKCLVFCSECGADWLVARVEDYDRAQQRLLGADISVRLPD
jgi:hypothetical protein